MGASSGYGRKIMSEHVMFPDGLSGCPSVANCPRSCKNSGNDVATRETPLTLELVLLIALLRSVFVTLLMVFLLIPLARACAPETMNVAAVDLNRLAAARTVDDAQIAARRARTSVEIAEASLLGCCPMVAFSLGDAARYLRRVMLDDDPEGISHARAKALRAFNAAIDDWNSRIC